MDYVDILDLLCCKKMFCVDVIGGLVVLIYILVVEFCQVKIFVVVVFEFIKIFY